MSPQHLDMIASQVIAGGTHVHANADLPGQFDAYHHSNQVWAARMDSLFGLDVTQAHAPFDAIITSDSYSNLSFHGLRSLAPLTSSYADSVLTWKIWHDVRLTSGTTIMTDTGYGGTKPGTPALIIKTNAAGQGRSAVNT